MSTKTEKILESLKSLSLLEASELVKEIEEAFGVSAAASAGVVMAAPGAPAAGAGEAAAAEKTEFGPVTPPDEIYIALPLSLAIRVYALLLVFAIIFLKLPLMSETLPLLSKVSASTDAPVCLILLTINLLDIIN